jgi:hypothetical protein
MKDGWVEAMKLVVSTLTALLNNLLQKKEEWDGRSK